MSLSIALSYRDLRVYSLYFRLRILSWGYMKRAEAREEERRRQMAPRRVYMSYFVRGEGQWCCGFLEPDLKTQIGRGCLFASADKLRDLVARTPTKLVAQDRNAFEHGLTTGRGGVWLEITAEQYAKLVKG